MAKQKNMTAEEVEAFRAKVDEVGELACAIREAISKVKIDDIPNAMDVARDAVCAARDLNNLALSLFSRHDLQQMRAKSDQTRGEIDELRKQAGEK